MTVDWSIRVADILSIVGFLIVAIAPVMVMKGDIRLLGLRVTHLEQDMGRFAEILNLMGRYEERMLNMQREISDLKRGRGFITDEAASR